ncbi:carboxymuconolactone decarboxylase family protein [Streptomyces sp. NPDC056227]|uniref:carboxymuconolactone decarboxylase family protein n=1 Tax=Streptomyces sp. NPDC056227 TaxID=3345753 RepID=UPI0035D84658
MSRIDIPQSIDEAPVASQPVLQEVNTRLGMLPNVFRLLSNSPTVLKGVVDLQNTLSRVLDANTRHALAMGVTEINGCNYCRTAHSFVAVNVGKLSLDEIHLNQAGDSSDPKRAAAVKFGRKVTELRGKVSDEDLQEVRAAGYTDAEVLEIVAFSVQTLMTNFINNLADTDVDFPSVEPTAA